MNEYDVKLKKKQQLAAMKYLVDKQPKKYRLQNERDSNKYSIYIEESFKDLHGFLYFDEIGRVTFYYNIPQTPMTYNSLVIPL